MKKNVTICLSVLMSLTVFSQLSSAGMLKIAIVSMEQVFDQYYKTKKANDLLKKRFDKSDLKKRELMDAVKTLKSELKTLAMEATDNSLSSADQDKKKRLSEKKYITYLDAEEKLIEFKKTTTKEFGYQMRQTQQKIVADIRKTVERYIKGKGIILVLDSSGKSMNNVESIIYYDSALDITDDIIKLLNKNAPGSIAP